MKSEHEAKVKRLTSAISNKSQKPVTVEDIPRLQDQLMELKRKGHVFRQILDANQRLREQFKRKEKNVLNFAGLENKFSKMFKGFLKM